MNVPIIDPRQERFQKIAIAAAKLNEKIECGQCEDSLLEYASYVWPVVEPAIPFIKGWVIEAICDHLEAVTYGNIKRLLINVPPGFTKSLLTDVFWPTWEWGPRNKPHLRYVCASYSSHLTIRDNMRSRNVVVSDRFQKYWGERFAPSGEQFDKIKFANNKTGWKLATSIGGVGVGERGDRFIIDDANNTMEMESEQVRFTTNMWFTEVVPDRLNSQKDSAIVVIQQRLHEDDVSGVAIAREMGYTHLMIPMEHDVHRHCVTVLGLDDSGEKIIWEDPRKEEGELAWPERFPQKIVDDLKRDKGAYAWAGQYQQTPEPRGGSIIKRDYWQLWDKQGAQDLNLEWNGRFPAIEYILASLDTAYTKDAENDASALTIWGVFRDGNAAIGTSGNPKIMLMHAWEERLEFHELVQKVIDTCTKDDRDIPGPRFKIDRLLIESKASGLSVAQELRRLIGFNGSFGIELINPQKQGDKVARVHAVQHIFSDGLVYAPDNKHTDKVIDQCAVFPKGSHDDLVDSTSMALRYLRDYGFALRREEHAVDVSESLLYKPRLTALYDV